MLILDLTAITFRIAPKYDALSKKETSVKFYKVDVDVADDVSQKAGIS